MTDDEVTTIILRLVEQVEMDDVSRGVLSMGKQLGRTSRVATCLGTLASVSASLCQLSGETLKASDDATLRRFRELTHHWDQLASAESRAARSLTDHSRGIGRKTMTQPKARIVSDGEDVFIVFDGVKIAKRGRPGTSQAKNWISLEPGFSVTTNADFTTLEVRYHAVLTFRRAQSFQS